MVFDRLRYVDRLVQAGIEESVARAQAEALRDALEETVATKDDVLRLETKIGQLEHALVHKIELQGRDLIIKGASMGVVLAGLLVGLEVFG